MLQQIPRARILHNHHQLVVGLKDFEKTDHILMSDFRQQLHFLFDLSTLIVVHYLYFIEDLDRHLLPRQLVNPQCHVPKSSFPYQSLHFVVIFCGLWNVTFCLNIGSYLFSEMLHL